MCRAEHPAGPFGTEGHVTAIDAVGRAAGLAGPARQAAPETGFAVSGAPSGAPSPAAAATAEIYPAAMAGLLALQEGVCGYRRDPAARRAGHALLGALAALQHALLACGGEAAALARLRALLGEMPSAEDPALMAALAAIALRCRIELARREAPIAAE